MLRDANGIPLRFLLLLRSYDVFVLRSERQALEEVPVVLDAGIRAAW
jgi:hypothetical protein